MRVVSATLRAISIPFAITFGHSLKSRDASESIIVKVILENGESGFGESAPRPYVTGETVPSCLQHIEQTLLPAINGHDFRYAGDPEALADLLPEVGGLLPQTGNERVIAFNAARAGVEAAILDALLKSAGKSLRDLFPPSVETVTYSAVIPAGPVSQARVLAAECARHGIRHVKIKVGTGDDRERVSAVREIMGEGASLRLDANGAFDVPGAIAFISSVAPYRIACIEQPIPRGDIASLAQVKADSAIPVMADESLITAEDAVNLIEGKACDLFNLRLSKCGGCCPTLRLIDIARTAGIGFQLGCQVGETAVLSAVGRHFAAHVADLMFVEGSYGSLLLFEDISVEPVRFGHGGQAPLLGGTGLGIQMREDLLEKYSSRTITVPMGRP